MKKVVAALAFALSCSSALADPRYSSIWNIGDSLSDTGRTYARTSQWFIPGNRHPYGPLYYDGRFSNGEVWVEYLNKTNGTKYQQDHNLAWGGATTGYNVGWGASLAIPKFEEQNTDLISIVQGDKQGSMGKSPLFTLWIGGNNFRQEVEDRWTSWTVDIPRASRALLDNVPAELAKLSNAVRSNPAVAEQGATYYVNTVPNIATTPKIASKYPSYVNELSTSIVGTNRYLKRELYAMQDRFDANNRSERIVIVDAAALLKEVQARPESFGFKEGSVNCIGADSGEYYQKCSASNVANYLFWDEFHPTTKGHEMIADYAWKTDLLESGQATELVRPYVANIEIRDRTFAGTIGGVGSLIKSGESTLSLSGQNTYAGGTRIDNGAVRISADANLGSRLGALTLQGGALHTTQSITMERNVVVNASVSADEAGGSPYGSYGGTFKTDAGTLLTLQNNTLSGTGNIAKAGLGTLDIRSTVTDRRALTEVKEGLLKINSTAEFQTDKLIVQKDALLGGSGQIGGKVVNYGTIVPGNSIGTLTIHGDFEQGDDGKIVVEVDTGRMDGLAVNGRILAGGDIHFAFDPHDKLSGQTFTLASSRDGVTGTFDEVVDLNPFLTQTMHYGANAVAVTFNRDFTTPATTANQLAVAQHLNRSYLLESQGDLDAVFFALDSTVTEAAGAQALRSLSGEAIGNATTASAIQRGQFVRAIEDRMADRRSGRSDIQPGLGLSGTIDPIGTSSVMRYAADGLTRTAAVPGNAAGISELSVWARALGGPGSVGGRNGFDLSSVGVLVGADKRFDGALLGVSFGYADGTTGDVNSSNRSWASAYQGSVYGSMDVGTAFIDAVAAYTYSDTRTTRALSFGNLSRTAVGSFGGDDLSAALKFGTRSWFGAVYAEPSIGLDWYRLSRDGFNEQGANSAGLSSRAMTQDIVQPSVGMRLTSDFTSGGILFSPEIRARYYHNLGDTVSFVNASLIGAPGASFTAAFTGINRNTGVVSAGLSAQKENLQVFSRYEAALGSDLTAHIFAGGLRYSW
ncbi:autotransporter domain-containing protein [Methylorubrum rhodesianum]|jgi:autotransporter-associated beta strand protein|uniref:autotransporter domain-containing protein n=1 Tax=Methylorubrum rhodesianum TaxID=29427 RepID=UPI0037470E57